MEENISSTTLIDISRYCSSFNDGDLWPSSQSLCSQSPVQRLFSPTPTRSTDSDSPVLPLAPIGWSLSSTFANIDLEPSLWSSNISSSQHQLCKCCHCGNKTENWSEKLQNRIRSHLNKDEKQTITPIQRPSPARTNTPSSSLNVFDDDDGTLRLHVSNIPFTWSKEKLAEVFGKYGTTFDVEVVYNERGSKGFGFVTFLAKKDALEAKRRMDREIVDGRRLVVNFAKPKQKTSSSSKEHSLTSSNWKTTSSSDRSHRVINNNNYQTLGFSTPPTARRQHLSGFSSLSSTPTRLTTTNNYHRYYL
ncbi:unnamed protein product [Rotaria sordida]|uniref:RRM domain-containing protein n=1 Tax=Rotaria sordida TaxID=392033 RepID=A0A814TDS6_9BILA|nr:unnamed protein product [Rotaria sordida]CAF1162308.1 unnamed protein product [Rotaria sordida]CAF1408812.1 unnamed protein product [Rotaria sordida]CAF1412876.1 unnamed protein product [Rotaria sordida]